MHSGIPNLDIRSLDDPLRDDLSVVPFAAQASLCVVNFNGEHFLRDTLGAALAAGDDLIEVVVIDNASTDGSLALIEKEFPAVTMVRLRENRGPGAARNAGYRAASSDRVLFIDNDVLLAPDCVAALMRALTERPAALIAMPRVVYRHEPSMIQYDGAGCHFLGLMTLEHADTPLEQAPDQIREIDSLVSACFLVDRSRWGDDSLFDESFFIYLEDHDLGLRTRLTGASILSVPVAVCYHGAGTPGLALRSTGGYQPLRIVSTIRNRWLILLKNYELRTLILLSPAIVLFETFQLAGAAKKRWLREWWDAASWIVSNWREIRTNRRRIQGQRRIPDREVLSGGNLPFTVQLASGRIELAAQQLLDRVCVSYWRAVGRFL